jgi:hypothetical protein
MELMRRTGEFGGGNKWHLFLVLVLGFWVGFFFCFLKTLSREEILFEDSKNLEIGITGRLVKKKSCEKDSP